MKLGLVIDLDTCVGCQACATACKQWNTSGSTGPLTDYRPYGRDPEGVWFNRVRAYEVADSPEAPGGRAVHFPMSCMHCEDADCVSVCPTGASYKRAEDGIVLIDQDKCMGCNLCAWACPYGARELDAADGTMKKCTLCIDRIYDEQLPAAERQPACVMTCPTNSRVFGDFDDPDSEVSRLTRARGGKGLLPELGYAPVNQYLPPRRPAGEQRPQTNSASNSAANSAADIAPNNAADIAPNAAAGIAPNNAAGIAPNAAARDDSGHSESAAATSATGNIKKFLNKLIRR